MKNTRKRKPLAVGAIARLVENGKNGSPFFTNSGRMMGPVQSGREFCLANARRVGLYLATQDPAAKRR